MTRVLLALAAVAGVVAGAWYAARARARAATELAPRSTEDVLRDASSSGVARWRAGVVRAAEAYRAALEELTTAIPAWSDGPEALRVAGVFRDAASVEGASSLRFRAWFLPSSPAPSSAIVADAGALELARAAAAALASVRSALAIEPSELAPELSSSAPPAELTPAEASAASSSSSSSSGSSSSSSSGVRTNTATREGIARPGIIPLPPTLSLVR